MSTSEHENKILIATPNVTGKFFNKSGVTKLTGNILMQYTTVGQSTAILGMSYTVLIMYVIQVSILIAS